MKRLRYENGEIDALDARLLAALTADGRASMAALARAVGLSAPSVAERVRRLEEAGVIRGYSADLDPKALGLPLAAWLRVRPVPGELDRVAGILRDLPEVVACDRVTGEDCFMARACVQSVEHLQQVIDALIPYSMTNTSIIQSSPVERRMPPLPARES